MERERIEQEKAELMRLESEQQLLVERKKLERERIELKRQQMRLEENRRGPLPPPPPASSSSSGSSGLKRGSGDRSRDYAEPERKRLNADHRRHSPPERVPDGNNRRMDASHNSGPGGRYDTGGRSKDHGPPVHKTGGFKRSNDFGGARNHRSDEQYDMPNRMAATSRDGGMMRRDTSSRPHQNNSMDHRPMKDR